MNFYRVVLKVCTLLGEDEFIAEVFANSEGGAILEAKMMAEDAGIDPDEPMEPIEISIIET